MARWADALASAAVCLEDVELLRIAVADEECDDVVAEGDAYGQLGDRLVAAGDMPCTMPVMTPPGRTGARNRRFACSMSAISPARMKPSNWDPCVAVARQPGLPVRAEPADGVPPARSAVLPHRAGAPCWPARGCECIAS